MAPFALLFRTMLLLAFAGLMTGCAGTGKNPQDPFEGYNRAMFDFNDKVDAAVMKPVAVAYTRVTPQFVQTGVGNFFGNINDVPTALNNFLQARAANGASDVCRVLVNTTIGIGGLFDVATPVGLPKHDQDFGQTLGRWGVPSGPYVVLPLIGPTTTRDALAMTVDFETDPWGYVYPVRLRNTGIAVRLIDHRAYMLDTSTLSEDAAFDRYEFVRDSYLQKRENKIYKGEPQEARETHEKAHETHDSPQDDKPKAPDES
jgi:phospholipid-binding lipoprotein MlaA